MKQIGVALHNYHSVKKFLPPGMAQYSEMDQYGVSTGQYNATYWSYFLLPYLEQEPLYNSIPFVQFPNWTAGNYLVAVQMQLPTLHVRPPRTCHTTPRPAAAPFPIGPPSVTP